MNERLAKAEALFHEACELAPEQCESFLRQSCGEDADLLREVTALLRASGIADQWLKDTDCAAAKADLGSSLLDGVSEGPGTVVGRYKLLEKIGEGGFGAVYMAGQEQPVRRKVALKIIKLGMDTKSVIARFETERQALALMDHPNIAKVLDAGATDTGRPYFVMELVRGVPVTRFCEENQLGITERLELFIQVCSAVQHAHQKGVIHRDIKPTNVLVTLNDGVPHPMLIDFGVAKAINQRLTEKTLFTNFAQMIGTPAYMSPEQAEMSKLDVDTRSDIYSLGVLLYELLTGTTPFAEERLRSAGYMEMQRIICEEKPLRPSTRLTRTIGPKPHSSLATRHSPLSSDLDWIVMKCLEKDRRRRYETANGLAEDLRRHLDNEPVLARPPSRLYEFRKSVQRHKVGFAATAAIILVLLAGVLVSTWQAVRATNAKREALVAQAQAVEAQRTEAAAGLAARQRSYSSDMNLAAQALDENNLGGALDLLNRQQPGLGQTDLRGWEWRYLWQQARTDASFTLCQINGEAYSLAASPDGHWLAVGAFEKGGVSVWDLRTRHEVKSLATNEEFVRVAFSPTGSLLASAGSEQLASGRWQYNLHLWNTATRQIIAGWPLDAECVGLAFSKEGRTLVTCTATGGTDQGRITLWRLPQGNKLASYPSGNINYDLGNPFATTPNLSLAACGLSQGLRVVDLSTGKQLWTASVAEGDITALAFSPDGETLASGGNGSDIRLWNVATGKELGPRLEGHTAWVSSLVFWPDGKKLASGSADRTIRIWDVASGKCLDVLRGHGNEMWQLTLLPDHKTLVNGCRDGGIRFWDTSVPHPRHRNVTIPAKVERWCFTPDSQSVLTLDQQGQVARWSGPDFRQKEPLISLPAGARIAPIFSPHGRFLAVGSTNGVVQIWDVTQRDLQCQLTNPTGPIFPTEFMQHGEKLITADPIQHLFQRWDLTTGLEEWVATNSWQSSGGRLSPDGRLAVALRRDEGMVLDLAERSNPKRSSGLPEILSVNLQQMLDIQEGLQAAFSPDGRQVAVSSDLGYVRVWDTASWQQGATLEGFPHNADSVAFSPDGKRLAAGGGWPGEVKLWDTGSWQNVLNLQGQESNFYITAFSPDGNTIGALDNSGTLVLWRGLSWTEIRSEQKAKAQTAATPQVDAP